LFDGEWKFLFDAKGRRSLYNLADDPAENEDLASRRPEIAEQLAERLRSLLPRDEFARYRTPVAQPELSSAAVEKLKSLGYAQ
ncbi:MAG: hypothetical protein ABW298_11045, partial [Candidatus Binatia bacterium]